MNLKNAIIKNWSRSVNTNSDPALRAKVKTIIGLIQLDREKIPVATTEPTTMPPYTTEPRVPNWTSLI